MKIKPFDAGQYMEENKFRLFMLILSVSLFALFLISGFSRHLNYMTSINDLSHFDQAIWGFLKGMPFLNTDTFNIPTSRLGFHFDPILAFFAPLYLMHPSVGWLIFGQALALSIACWPIFFLAKKIFMSEKIAFIWAVIFSFNPFILNAAAWDFHAVTLAVPFIAGSFLAVEMKKINWLLFCCIFILLCKEHFGLLVFGFGFLWGIKHRKLRSTIFLIALGLIHIWLVFYIIMPHFSPTGRHLMLSEGQGQLSRYAWLGNSLIEILSEIIKNPFQTVKTILIGPFNGILYLTLLFLPFLGLSVIGIEFLIPGLADLGANLLSANPMPRGVFSYHSATLIPVITVAAMYGTKRIVNKIKKYSSKEISILLVILSIVLCWIFFPFLNLPGSFDIWKQKRVFKFHDSTLAEVKNLIKKDWSVSVQANLGPHFSQRKEIYIYPNRIDHVDAVILRLESPTMQLQGHPGIIGSLSHHLLMPSDDFLNSINNLLSNNKFKGIYWIDPWLIFIKKDDENQFSPIDTTQIKKKIALLELNWQLNETGEPQ